MTFKINGFQLRAAAVAMGIAAAVVLLLGILLPVGTPPSTSTGVRSAPPSTSPSTQSVATAISFTDLLDVTLRRPLVDARPTTNPAGIAQWDATLGLRLIGTIIEPRHSYAIFTDAAGKTELKSVGEKTGPAQVLAVNADAVTLFLNGKSVVLHVVKPAVVMRPGI